MPVQAKSAPMPRMFWMAIWIISLRRICWRLKRVAHLHESKNLLCTILVVVSEFVFLFRQFQYDFARAARLPDQLGRFGLQRLDFIAFYAYCDGFQAVQRQAGR